MKVLTFADYHLGVKNYGKIDPITGLNTREIQTLEIFDYMIDYAIENKIPVIVAAGDMYKNNLPSPTLQDEFNKRVKRVSDNNIAFLILDGNHDVSKMDTTSSALKTYTTLGVKNVIHTRTHLEYVFEHDGEKVKFVFLPTYHSKEDIEQIVQNTKYEGDPIVYIGHMTIRGALMNDWLIEEKEIFIEADTFKQEGVVAAVLGHLHKHQVLHENPVVYYTGSTQRIDFNEEKQDKGFVVLDINDGKTNLEFVPVPSQKFYTLKLKFENDTDATNNICIKLKKDKNKIENAISRVKLELDDESLVHLNEKKIYETIYQLNPFHVLNIQKQLTTVKAVRNKELTEGISIEKGLELYYKGKSRAAERIALGKEIINALEQMK